MDTTLKRCGNKLLFRTKDPAEEPINVTWQIKKKQSKKKKRKTKKQRQAWWNSLTKEEKRLQIAKWKAKKDAEVKPEKKLEYDPKYPWVTEGVNEENREQWQQTILNQNPWFDKSVFEIAEINRSTRR